MHRVPPDALVVFVRKLVSQLGASPEAAERVAVSLVEAELRGHTSHGLLALGMYADMVEGGVIDPSATPDVTRMSPVATSVDGNSAFGQVVGQMAVDEGIRAAKESGMSVVGICDGTHLGRIGEWAERVVDAGLLFGSFVNTQSGNQWVAPPGTATRRLGTNPVTFGVPTFGALEFPLVLDMATSQVAHGKFNVHETEDEPLPPEWTIDENGDAVRNASEFHDGRGAMLPLGGRTSGYKGFGLSVVTDLFAAIVGGGYVSGEIEREWFSNAAMFLFVDPTLFSAPDDIARRTSILASHVRSADTVPTPSGDTDEESAPLLPGEKEYRTLTERRREGVPLSGDVVEALTGLANDYGSDPSDLLSHCG